MGGLNHASAQRKGIILAGGSGTRLWPITIAVSKQLLPIWDKPTIYYPLTTLMDAGIREYLIISTARDIPLFRNLFGDGSHLGISINYAVQNAPKGIAEALIIAEEFLDHCPCALILGDNIFHGTEIRRVLKTAVKCKTNSIIACPVADPERYGVIHQDASGKIREIIEKPKRPESNFAVTGLYFYDSSAPQRAQKLSPSDRNELEITDLNRAYLHDNCLDAHYLTEDATWLDTGTNYTLLQASQLIETIQSRQGILIGSPELAALEQRWIDRADVLKSIDQFEKSSYSKMLSSVLKTRFDL